MGLGKEDKVKVAISKELYERAKAFVEEGGFNSVEELIEFLLSEVLSEESEGLSKEEEEKVKERLKSLGYM